MNKKTKVLITGGTGFIGRHLIAELQKGGHAVSLLYRARKNVPKGVRYFKGDITNRKVVQRAMKGMDYVYHLAGVLGTEELLFRSEEAVRVNIIGAIHVMEAAVKNNTKMLLVSKPNPWLNTYSITKETSEKFCLMYQKELGLRATIVQWFSVYGPGQKYRNVQKAVPTFIVRALKGEPIPIFGNGLQTADFIYVSDTVRATVLVAQNKKAEGKIIEIGSGKETRIKDMAKSIIKLTGSKSTIQYLPMRKGEDKNAHVVANTRLLKKLVSYSPSVRLEDGLQRTILYYQKLLGV